MSINPINQTLTRTITASLAEFNTAATNSTTSQTPNAQNHAPSPIRDAETLHRFVQEGSKSPERVQRCLNVSLTTAVSKGQIDLVKAIFSRFECRPSHSAIKEATAKSYMHKIGSIADSLYDLSEDQLNWARKQNVLYEILKNQPENADQNPSQP